MIGNPNPALHRKRSARRWRWVGAAAAVIALALVFNAYRQPEMMMLMAQQLWSCF